GLDVPRVVLVLLAPWSSAGGARILHRRGIVRELIHDVIAVDAGLHERDEALDVGLGQGQTHLGRDLPELSGCGERDSHGVLLWCRWPGASGPKREACGVEVAGCSSVLGGSVSGGCRRQRHGVRVEVTGREVTRTHLAQGGLDLAADIAEVELAARVEATARRWIERARDLAAQDDLLALPLDVRVWRRDRRDECLA